MKEAVAVPIEPPPDTRPGVGEPVGPADERVLAITLERGVGDVMIVDHNKALCVCVRCNTAVLALGGAKDGVAAAHYNCKYCTKGPVDLQESVPMVHAARAATLRDPSRADDVGTAARSAQHLMTRLANMMTGLQEYSEQQAAAALLGIPSSYSNLRHGFLYVHQAVRCLSEASGVSTEAEHGGAAAAGVDQVDDTVLCDLLESLVRDNEDAGDVCAGDDQGGIGGDEADADWAGGGGGGGARLRRDVGGGVTSTQQCHVYGWRPRELWFLSLGEFVSVLARKDMKKGEDGVPAMPQPATGMGAGRRSNACFRFREGYPGHDTEYLALRSAQVTPILAGQPRPTYAQWKKDPVRFASYYATLHVPWWLGGEDGDTVMGVLSAENYFKPAAFCTLMRAWSDPSACWVHRARYWEYHNVVRNTVSTAKQRRAAMMWRTRAADKWSEMEPGAAPAFQADTRPDAPQHDAEMEAALDAVVEELQRAAEASVGGAADQSAPRRAHLEKMGEVFVGLHQPGPEHGDGGNVACPAGPWSMAVCGFEPGWVASKLEELAEAPQEQAEALVVDVGAESLLDVSRVSDWVSGRGPCPFDVGSLNAEQKATVLDCGGAVARKEHMLMMLTGGPGTGKSYTCKMVEAAVIKCGFKVVGVAFMWSAVSQMTVGTRTSIHSFLKGGIGSFTAASLNDEEKMRRLCNDAKLQHVREAISEGDLLVVDEVSCVDVALFVGLDVVLRAAFKSSEAFGGISVLLLGDFKQLGPTGGVGLVDALVRCSSRYAAVGDVGSAQVELRAARLLASFQRTRLVEQMRAAADEQHKQLINRFELDREEPPVDLAVVQSFQMLTPQLLQDDPEFLDASIAVQSNEERCLLNRLCAQSYAVRNRQPVFRWVTPLKEGRNAFEAHPPVKAGAFVDAGAGELVVWFVPGMPMVTTQRVGHKGHEVHNGTRVVAVGFEFANGVEWAMPSGVAPGTVVDVPQPEHVVVQVVDTGLMVPLSAAASPEPMSSYLKHAGPAVKASLSRMPPSVRVHPVEAAFAFTHNKLQGATLSRLILSLADLNACKLGAMSLEKLYVALTRVRFGKHMAIYPCAQSDLVHLLASKHPVALKLWHAHYDGHGRWMRAPLDVPSAKGDKIVKALGKKHHGLIKSLNVEDLRSIAKAHGASYAHMSMPQLLELAKPSWDRVGSKARTLMARAHQEHRTLSAVPAATLHAVAKALGNVRFQNKTAEEMGRDATIKKLWTSVLRTSASTGAEKRAGQPAGGGSARQRTGP